MTVSLMPSPRQRFFTNSGAPAAGHLLYCFDAGTSTPRLAYQDAAGLVPHENPIRLDEKGEALVYFSGNYKIDLRTPYGATVSGYPVDNFNTDALGLGSIVAQLATSAGAGMLGFLQSGAGAVLRTLDSKGRDSVNIRDFGGKGDGIANDTVAFTSAVNALGAGGGRVEFPAGTFRITPLVFSGLNNVTLAGAGRNSSIIQLTSTGIGVRFTNCQWLTLRHLTFTQAGSPQALVGAIGVQLDGGSNNAMIEECAFHGFAGGGLNLLGVSGTQLSGHQVKNNYFLGSGASQLGMTYCNDFHVEGNQFGVLAGAAAAAYGALIDRSSAGNYSGNYHWGNVVGCKSINSLYNRILGNRFEENNQQGLWVESANNCIISENTFHTNSLQSFGTYDNAYFKNLVQCTISNNTSFDFSGGTSYHRWGMYIDILCDGLDINNNKAANGYGVGPIYVAPSNLNTSHDVTLPFCAAGIFVAAGASTYFGPSSEQTNELGANFIVGRRAVVQSFFAGTSTAPGAAQTYTFTLYKNGVATAMTGGISGAAGFSVDVGSPAAPILIAERDRISLRMETTAGAAATYVDGVIKLDEF